MKYSSSWKLFFRWFWSLPSTKGKHPGEYLLGRWYLNARGSFGGSPISGGPFPQPFLTTKPGMGKFLEKHISIFIRNVLSYFIQVFHQCVNPSHQLLLR